MPVIYDAVLILRSGPKEHLATVLKRAANLVFKEEGYLRKIYNLGFQNTPYKISKDHKSYRSANYFLVELTIPPGNLYSLKEGYKRDSDIVRYTINKQEDLQFDHNACTLEDELKPPAYRSEVIEMIQIARRRFEKATKRKVKMNMNLGYYPFQR